MTGGVGQRGAGAGEDHRIGGVVGGCNGSPVWPMGVFSVALAFGWGYIGPGYVSRNCFG